MSKAQFKSLRHTAIEYVEAWSIYHWDGADLALADGNDKRLDREMVRATRADECLEWLRTCSKSQFARWFARYEQTGCMYLA